MARMIPPVIDPDCPSPGEVSVFRALASDSLTREWAVLHSLDVAEHQRRSAGEIDFVIVVPHKGVLCLEVKAHRQVRYAQGLWYLGSAGKPEARSPFRQASDAMRSIQRRIALRRPDLAGVMIWSAVAFTNADVSASSAEWHDWQMLDRRSLARRSIGEHVGSVLDSARDFLASRPGVRWFHPERHEPTPSQCEAIVRELRPEFEYFEPPKVRRQRLAAELKRYTEEQFFALDTMESNARVVFTGPAGTGKTLLALEAAWRSGTRGERTLLLCYNRRLGRWLEEQIQPFGGLVRAGTLHRYMLEIAGISAVPAQAGAAYWSQEVPLQAVDRLLAREATATLFDTLILDEAQDMLTGPYLDVLDLSLRGGWAEGRWRLFGDFEKQAIYDADLSIEEFLLNRGRQAPVCQLRVNCRNPPRVAALVRLLGGMDPDYTWIRRPDDGADASLSYYRDQMDQQQQLVNLLQRSYDDGQSGSDIVVLSPRAEGSAASLVTMQPWKDRLRPLERSGPGLIPYCSIAAFKGMEAAVVIVTDIEHLASPHMQALFYIATTRATHRLSILAQEQAKRDILAALTSGHASTGASG